MWTRFGLHAIWGFFFAGRCSAALRFFCTIRCGSICVLYHSPICVTHIIADFSCDSDWMFFSTPTTLAHELLLDLLERGAHGGRFGWLEWGLHSMQFRLGIFFGRCE